MDRIISALEEIRSINEFYNIPNEKAEKIQTEIKEAKVCTPVIGKFSSGKSALVNTLLGYNRRILQEDITPETSIPAEIVYSASDEYVTVNKNDGTKEILSVDAYRKYTADASSVKDARILLKNSFLEKVPDVMLVDMPGFESGFEIHNKAIDNYLPRSLAYIITFPADDMIVRSSVGNILKELCLNEMPLCIVITKYDKRNPEYDVSLAKMKESLKRYVGKRELRFCRTSSYDGDAEELKAFLLEIQEKAQVILSEKYRLLVLSVAEITENYLKTCLNNSRLSESELDAKEEKLKQQMSSLEARFAKEQEDFRQEIGDCIEEIKNDVRMAVEAEESTLVTMTMNNQSINPYLNNVVRNAVTVSIKKRFVSRVEKYLKRVANTINSKSFSETDCSFAFNPGLSGADLSAGAVAAATAALSLVLGPVAGIVAGLLMILSSNKKREEAKQQIRMRIQSEVIPKVLQNVGNEIEKEIKKQVSELDEAIAKDLKIQQETLEKAMADLRGQIDVENARKEELSANIQNDLKKIEEIRNDLG